MEISLEIFEENGKTMIYIADENGSGAKYSAETADDAGKALTFYLQNYGIMN